jgi:hypothetical protein
MRRMPQLRTQPASGSEFPRRPASLEDHTGQSEEWVSRTGIHCRGCTVAIEQIAATAASGRYPRQRFEIVATGLACVQLDRRSSLVQYQTTQKKEMHFFTTTPQN